MLIFSKENNKVVLSYTTDFPGPEWVYKELEKSGKVTIGKVFNVTKDDLIGELITDFNEDDESSLVEFEIASKIGNYYCFPKKILSLEHDLYIHEGIELNRKVFIAERGISIFSKIDKMVDRSIYVGGEHENAIPESVFKTLLKSFPNSYELYRYASARISGILSSYIETNDDYEERYHKYLNKKISRKGVNLSYRFSELELIKYKNLLDKLNIMLNDEISYTETQWQEELLQIILLLYPKYIHVFKEATIRDTYNLVNRRIDYLLVDSSGNVDIIEIKKPFDKCIVTDRTYRDNYIPLRELSGTVMQIEKYIFYLNKCGRKGEEKLTEDYKSELGEGFKLRITNPSGIVVMGRNKGLSQEQNQDFEVIKRKYKNVIDIITYDDLIDRLEFTIKQWTNKHNNAN